MLFAACIAFTPPPPPLLLSLKLPLYSVALPLLFIFPQRTLKSEHLLFQLYHLHVDREAVKKALRKKKQEEEMVRVWG